MGVVIPERRGELKQSCDGYLQVTERSGTLTPSGMRICGQGAELGDAQWEMEGFIKLSFQTRVLKMAGVFSIDTPAGP